MYSRNRRLAAVFAAAALGAGPALAAGAAQAAPGNPSVEFSGGSVLNMLVCRSEPSASRLTVPAQSKVTFVNRLGQNATLRIDGRTVTAIGANQAVPVVFHFGPVVVSMSIACSAGVVEEFRSVTIAVTPRPAAPAPTVTPTAKATSTPPAPHAAAASARSGSATPPVDPAAPPVDPWAPSAGLPASGAPDFIPGTGDVSQQDPGAAEGATDVGDVVAASGEPVHGPSGLLAMIATVLTIGVGVAAVRTILARRTSRLDFA
jgi:hypothetical protein